jgi:hypothetical protein
VKDAPLSEEAVLADSVRVGEKSDRFSILLCGKERRAC